MNLDRGIVIKPADLQRKYRPWKLLVHDGRVLYVDDSSSLGDLECVQWITDDAILQIDLGFVELIVKIARHGDPSKSRGTVVQCNLWVVRKIRQDSGGLRSGSLLATSRFYIRGCYRVIRTNQGFRAG